MELEPLSGLLTTGLPHSILVSGRSSNISKCIAPASSYFAQISKELCNLNLGTKLKNLRMGRELWDLKLCSTMRSLV